MRGRRGVDIGAKRLAIVAPTCNRDESARKDSRVRLASDMICSGVCIRVKSTYLERCL